MTIAGARVVYAPRSDVHRKSMRVGVYVADDGSLGERSHNYKAHQGRCQLDRIFEVRSFFLAWFVMLNVSFVPPGWLIDANVFDVDMTQIWRIKALPDLPNLTYASSIIRMDVRPPDFHLSCRRGAWHCDGRVKGPPSTSKHSG